MAGNMSEKCVCVCVCVLFLTIIIIFNSTFLNNFLYAFHSLCVPRFGNDKLFWQSFKQLHSFVCLMSKMVSSLFFFLCFPSSFANLFKWKHWDSKNRKRKIGNRVKSLLQKKKKKWNEKFSFRKKTPRLSVKLE